MDSILNNLSDPSWWFTGIFFIFAASALPKCLKYLQRKAKVTFRGARARRLRRIKLIRRDELLINYEISKSSAHYVIFVVVGLMFLLAFISGPLTNYLKVSPFFGLLLSSPLFAFELLWLRQDAFVKEAIRYRGKLRLTLRST